MKSTRRGKSRRNALTKFKFLLNNVRGLKTKMTTTKRIIEEEKPVMFALVETKLRKNDVIETEFPDYKMERVDRDEDGGGVLIAIRKTLKQTWITTKECKQHNCDMLWVKMDNNKIRMKIGIVYMPQESRTKVDTLKEIYSVIEAEIFEAAEGNYHLLLLGDLNCKIGKSTIEIKGNTDQVTKGGRLLLQMVKRCRLAIGNAQDVCQGLWTRIEGNERSVLDYVIMFEDDIDMLRKMEVDEDKIITPYYIDTSTNERKYSDHCMIKGTLNVMVTELTQPKHVRVMTEKGWIKFRSKMEEKKISTLIDKEGGIKSNYKEWSKTIMETHEECKEKVKRIRPWKVSRNLITAKKNITRILKTDLEKEDVRTLKQKRTIIIQQIEEEEHKREYQRICKQIDDIKREGGVHSNAFWKVREKLMKKPDEIAYRIADKDGRM